MAYLFWVSFLCHRYRSIVFPLFWFHRTEKKIRMTVSHTQQFVLFIHVFFFHRVLFGCHSHRQIRGWMHRFFFSSSFSICTRFMFYLNSYKNGDTSRRNEQIPTNCLICLRLLNGRTMHKVCVACSVFVLVFSAWVIYFRRKCFDRIFQLD